MSFSFDNLPFKSGQRILFQGDSLTDTGRRRDAMHDLGQGYVAQIRGFLAVFRPDLRVEILSRGISGNRTIDLMARWQEDCLDLKPDWLSVFIGVNDVWRKRSQAQGGPRHVPLDEYVTNYHYLLDQVAAAGIPNLVLVSPTLIDKYLQSDLNTDFRRGYNRHRHIMMMATDHLKTRFRLAPLSAGNCPGRLCHGTFLRIGL